MTVRFPLLLDPATRPILFLSDLLSSSSSSPLPKIPNPLTDESKKGGWSEIAERIPRAIGSNPPSTSDKKGHQERDLKASKNPVSETVRHPAIPPPAVPVMDRSFPLAPRTYGSWSFGWWRCVIASAGSDGLRGLFLGLSLVGESSGCAWGLCRWRWITCTFLSSAPRPASSGCSGGRSPRLTGWSPMGWSLLTAVEAPRRALGERWSCCSARMSPWLCWRILWSMCTFWSCCCSRYHTSYEWHISKAVVCDSLMQHLQ